MRNEELKRIFCDFVDDNGNAERFVNEQSVDYLNEYLAVTDEFHTWLESEVEMREFYE